MRWVKRGLWVAAWSFWAWLGFGLYRELPREIGLPLHTLDFDDAERISRIVDGTDLAVSRRVAADGARHCRVWDLATGTLSLRPVTSVLDDIDARFLKGVGPQTQVEDLEETLRLLLKSLGTRDIHSELDFESDALRDTVTGAAIDAISAERSIVEAGPLRISLTRSFGDVTGHRTFGSDELWRFAWGAWITTRSTFAVRSLSDGRVEYRVDRTPTWFTDDGRFCVDGEGNVFALPPPPNHPLLALCQTILALPLILLWAILRWRRNRKLRLASVQP